MMFWVVRYGPTLLAAVAACGALWWAYGWAWDRGYAARSAEVTEDTRELNERLDRLDRKHRAVTRAYMAGLEDRAALQQELDNAARQDPDADRLCFGPDSVQRLNAIR